MKFYNEEWNVSDHQVLYYVTETNALISVKDFQSLTDEQKKKCRAVFKDKGDN